MTTIMNPSVRGSGKITGVFFNAAADVAAVASEFPLLANPRARASYGGRALRYRVALYRRDSRIPFAAFDDLLHPVHDVDFHPTGSSIAIGAGSYDGGYCFEGDLLVWNWLEKHGNRPFNHVPEVLRCRFNAAGDELEAWVRPWDEEWGLPADAEDASDAAFNTLFAVRAKSPGASTGSVDLVIDPANIAPCDVAPKTSHPPESRLAEWFGETHWISRGAINDIAWLDSCRIAVAHAGCQLEIYATTGERIAAYAGAGGHGSEILRAQGLHVHVVESSQPRSWEQHSRLCALTSEGLRQTHAWNGEYTFSVSATGVALGRQNRSHHARKRAHDLLVDLNTGAERRVDLGHYDCFNHYVGIRGAPFLFLLQGTPASSHERKVLCIVQPDGQVQRLWPVLKADDTPASHAMELCGSYVEDTEGAGVVISGQHYSPTVDGNYAGFIYRKPLNRDSEQWRHQTRASASAIVYLPASGLIAAAFLDGGLLLIEARTGAVVLDAQVHVDGLPTVIYAMDAHDDKLAVGTLDGRIAILAADALRTAPAAGNKTERHVVNLD
ncbi:hypothetical protein RAS12_00695 [Achromobacter seleniivolatilans]|uniref:Uncharacterized protein n=1 Tax=Achromobacter seleniivolatilans TaxID=3047478 RepID=A0ABY9M2K7_9BURK|nr:hypothetical protein [Achromobacter sp. R39]WMD20922.1 hypothetical protein RAS12_00695 [Achromobacter sp. R39]